MTDYIVKGPAVVLPLEGGSERYLYRGAIVGDGYTAEGIKHAKSLGLIEKFTPVVASDEGSPASAKSAPKSQTTIAGPYDDVNVVDLKAEVAKRNEGRGDDAKVEVAEPGNKAELIAALVADDAKK